MLCCSAAYESNRVTRCVAVAAQAWLLLPHKLLLLLLLLLFFAAASTQAVALATA
jgi:uncharacterized integral membrane protein